MKTVFQTPLTHRLYLIHVVYVISLPQVDGHLWEEQVRILSGQRPSC